MTADDVVQQLNGIVALDEFASRSGQLVDAWITAGVGLEAVHPILRFIEDNPGLDFGTPGSLAHFVERFYGKGYDALLIESIRRKPTAHTAWMLNRLINGAKDSDLRARLIALMREAREHPLADKTSVESIEFFLEDL
jgi:hypothetical protein